VSDYQDQTGSKFTLFVKSLLVESGGSFVVGRETHPFGSTSGSIFELGLYGSNEDYSVTCSTADCGVPPLIWNNSNCLSPNPSMPTHKGTSIRDCITPGSADAEMGDYFYQYQSLVFETRATNYFGRKVLAVSYGGTLELHGAMGNSYQSTGSGASWARVSNPVSSGEGVEFQVDSFELDGRNGTTPRGKKVLFIYFILFKRTLFD
jgi:hypothetical protein